MRKKLLCLLLVLIMPVMVLAGCGKEDKSFEGEICVLEFKESYTTMIPITTLVWNGQFSVPIITYYWRTYPDRWYVKVRRFNTKKQEYEYDDCYVTEDCFNKLNIGDWFIYNADYCFAEEPYTQERSNNGKND